MANEQLFNSSSMEEATGQVSNDTIKLELNVSDIIEELEQNLRGKVARLNEDGKWVWTQEGEPKLNEVGLRSLVSDILPLISRNSILSDLDDAQINNITYDIASNTAVKLSINWKNWGIKKSELSSIKNMVRDTVYISLRRARRGMTLTSINKSFSRSETFYPTKKGSSLFSNPVFNKSEGG